MAQLLGACAGAWVGVAGLALVLSALSRLGRVGGRMSATLARAPWLDVVVGLFTIVPWAAGVWSGGWRGLVGALLGQVLGLWTWIVWHELTHREAKRGPRLIKAHHRIVGRWRNQAALWVTAVVLPVFWLIRLAEAALYPWLVWLLDFPRYRQREWVNVSRQKFDGLVGHDLIWCLYCDWMTGVYALGGEMLRNVESFWCPIRFYDGKKCENCAVDFPDVVDGWVPADGSMADAERVVLAKYGDGQREWFGHPARLTVHGVPAEDGETAVGARAEG